MRVIGRILVFLLVCIVSAVATAHALPTMTFGLIRWIAYDMNWIFFLLSGGIVVGGGVMYFKRIIGEALIAVSLAALVFVFVTALSVSSP